MSKTFTTVLSELNTYKTSGSGAEKKFYDQFTRGGETIEDHDTDPANWTASATPTSKTEINAQATAGDQAIPKVPADVQLIDDDVVGKKDKSAVSNRPSGPVKVTEAQADVRDVYRDEMDTLLDDVRDLFETLKGVNGDMYAVKRITTSLREVRDQILESLDTTDEGQSLPTAAPSNVTESLAGFEAAICDGVLDFEDGSKIDVDLTEAATMYAFISELNESAQLKMINVISESKEDYTNTLDYAKTMVNETSVEKAEKYLQRAVGEHGMANFAKRSTEDNPKENAFWKRKEGNRKKGISRAIDVIDKKKSTK